MKYVRAAEAAEIISQRCGMPLAALVDIFADIPPVDAVPVVRCKDCRCECGEQHAWETDNDFCSYGERL